MFSASFHVKMNKIASFYVIFAFSSIEFEEFYVNLPSQSERNAYDMLKQRSVMLDLLTET